MKFDLTVTISVILALSAILSPVIVAFINNKHTLKIKRIESYDIAKRASLEQFSKACGELFANYVLSNEINMVKALYGLVPYYNTDFSVIKDIVDYIDDEERLTSNINHLLAELKKEL